MNEYQSRGLLSVSVVVPVYNSERSLHELISRLENTLRPRTSEVEVILVNDGSRDHSWEVICELAQKHESVRGFSLLRNYGQQNALLCGIRMARHEIIVTLDDDLQHPPEEIPKMLDKLSEGYDVVFGPPERRHHSIWRNATAAVTKIALQSVLGVKGARNVSAFRVFRAHLREAFADYQSPSVSVNVLLSWSTTRFASVPVRHDERKIGKSNYGFGRLVTQAFNLMTGFSVLPLQVASVIGFVFTCVGLVVLFYVLGRYLVTGASVPGFTFLACMIAIFAGAQLFTLGIMGEYLSRMYQRMMNRPVYVVRSRTRGGEQNAGGQSRDRKRLPDGDHRPSGKETE